jgi:uncharacterized protein
MFRLQELAKQGQHTKTLTVSERLPHWVTSPCDLAVAYHVEAKEGFYLVHLHVHGALHLQCQRCLDEFNYLHDNNTNIAVCRDDERAEKLLEHYECIVAPDFQVSLEDLIIDELHLYVPQFHPEVTDCSSEINQFLSGKSELD